MLDSAVWLAPLAEASRPDPLLHNHGLQVETDLVFVSPEISATSSHLLLSARDYRDILAGQYLGDPCQWFPLISVGLRDPPLFEDFQETDNRNHNLCNSQTPE